jgi:hypothetical protein
MEMLFTHILNCHEIVDLNINSYFLSFFYFIL